MNKEITIVGGGIAGLSLGIALRRRGVPANLFEAGKYPRHRVCGEFISGVEGDTLDSLGVTNLLADSEKCSSSAWFDRIGQFYTVDLPTPALGISRHRLDQRMAERFAEQGGILKEGERFREPDSPLEGTVLATGRPPNTESQWIGLKAHLSDFPIIADLEMHLGEGGYLGISRIEDGKVNACGLFRQRPELNVKRETALTTYLAAAGLDTLLERIDSATFDPNSHIAVSAFALGRQRENVAAVRVGDRHSIIGPFTGNGMSLAFQSSETVLPFVENYASGQTTWTETIAASERALGSLSRRRLAFSKTFHPFLTHPAGRRLMKLLAGRDLLPFDLFYRLVR